VKTCSRTIASICAAGLTAALVLPLEPAEATEGYFQHGYGSVAKFIGGAGVAHSHDAMAQALNPAGLTNVGNQVNVGLSFFSPFREFDASGGSGAGFVANESVESSRNVFFIPNFGVSYEIDDVSTVGLSVYGNGGMNTAYESSDSTCSLGDPGVFCDGDTGVDLVQTFIQFTYAREIFDGVSVGVGPYFAAQAFEAQGFDGFASFSADPANLSDNGHDWSYGVGGRFGVQVELPAGFAVGAAYQTRTYMSRFDDYAGLFADQGDFDIPAALQVGIAWEPIDHLYLVLDYRHIWYSDIAAVGNPFDSSSPLGFSDGPGFGWDDTDTVKVGFEWDFHEDWTLRTGYSYTTQPVSSSEVLFNILAPGVVEHHITAGISYNINENHTVHFGGFFAPSASVSGTNPLDPAQEIELKMHQFEFVVGWAWRF
jgi:long-chain fatty acid transport protein